MKIEGIEEEFIYLAKLVQESVKLPVSLVVGQSVLPSSSWGLESMRHPLFEEPSGLIRSVIGQGADKTAFPTIRTSSFLEQFIVLPVRSEADKDGQAVLVIGPALLQQPSDEIALNLLNDLDIPRRERAGWLSYWNGLPIASRMQLLHIGALAHFAANRESLRIADILEHSLHYERTTPRRENVELALSDRREASLLHSGREYENRMLGHIRNGDAPALLNTLAEFPTIKVGVLSKRSQLRNLKNLAISGIAIGMRAAIDGGLYEELAYMLSDLHIQHIEELSEAGEVEAALNGALLDFAERVREARRQWLSRPVRACQDYIFNHLYEELTADRLAEEAGLNANYLSSLFKKETGFTLMNFIQRERIEEAKKLLTHSRDTLSAIGLRLGFYDHAHFVKAFKKHAGMTPKRYRDRRT